MVERLGYGSEYHDDDYYDDEDYGDDGYGDPCADEREHGDEDGNVQFAEREAVDHTPDDSAEAGDSVSRYARVRRFGNRGRGRRWLPPDTQGMLAPMFVRLDDICGARRFKRSRSASPRPRSCREVFRPDCQE